MAALFKLSLFIWIMLSYNWLDRNLYSMALTANRENIDYDELEDHVYSQWTKKLSRPAPRKASSFAAKKDQILLKNMLYKKHSPWIMLKNDRKRHYGSNVDDNYIFDGSRDSSDNDLSEGEGEEEEEPQGEMRKDDATGGDVWGELEWGEAEDDEDREVDLEAIDNPDYKEGGKKGKTYSAEKSVYSNNDKGTYDSKKAYKPHQKQLTPMMFKCSKPYTKECLDFMFHKMLQSERKNKKNKNKFKLKPPPESTSHLKPLLIFDNIPWHAIYKNIPDNYSLTNQERNKLLKELQSLAHENTFMRNFVAKVINNPKTLGGPLKYPKSNTSLNKHNRSTFKRSLQSLYKLLHFLSNFNFTYSPKKNTLSLNHKKKAYVNSPLKKTLSFQINLNHNKPEPSKQSSYRKVVPKEKKSELEIMNLTPDDLNKTLMLIMSQTQGGGYSPNPQKKTKHTPMDVHININVNTKNRSLPIPSDDKTYTTYKAVVPEQSEKEVIAEVAGEWTVWRKWSICSVTCGIGHRMRNRDCLPHGASCSGSVSEKASCFEIVCDSIVPVVQPQPQPQPQPKPTEYVVINHPPSGHWTIWNEWSECSRSCGLGSRERVRVCLPYGFDCKGDQGEMASCMMQTCDMVEKIHRGAKFTQREGPYYGANHPEPETTPERITATQATMKFSPGTWKTWEQWSQCSVSCGYGVQKRTRECRSKSCLGVSSETVHCMERHCVPEVIEWSPWSPCSVTCDHGHRYRNHTCLLTSTSCTGVRKEVVPCTMKPCHRYMSAQLEWSTWTGWTQCSVKCGTGQSSRYRKCLNVVSPCAGHHTELSICKATDCFMGLTIKSSGNWVHWSHWSSCSVQCNIGHRKRRRICLPRGSDCKGHRVQLADCFIKPCRSGTKPRRGHWTSWTHWTPCTKDCKTQHKNKHRVCLPKGATCEGSRNKVEKCSTKSCTSVLPIKTSGSWTSWSEWSECSVTCNIGIQKRYHTCIPKGSRCNGKAQATKDCMISRCKDNYNNYTSGIWTTWHEWSRCSVTCNKGRKLRYRECFPSSSKCIGEGINEHVCVERPCHSDLDSIPNYWSSWGDWSACSTTCNRGFRKRYRSCLQKTMCIGEAEEENECVEKNCPSHYVDIEGIMVTKWTSWSQWSSCSATCETGLKTRYRKCLPEGIGCEGESTDETKCFRKRCSSGIKNETQSSWTSWSEWSRCSVTCDSGIRKRYRSCLPKGKKCVGEAAIEAGCIRKPCNLDVLNETLSSWTSWSEWSHCSATACDKGFRKRFRSCLPKGNNCYGKASHKEGCIHKLCKAEENNASTSWTSWSEWSGCSAACDQGFRKRYRTCLPKGSQCAGDLVEEGECIRKPCNADLVNHLLSSWTSWSEWSGCSTTCDNGFRRRYRSCLPKNSVCNGESEEKEECIRKNCNGVTKVQSEHSNMWTSWSTWSSCSVSCDRGLMKRYRKCLLKGQICHGKEYEELECVRNICNAAHNNSHTSWTSWSEWSGCSSECDTGFKKRYRRCLPKGSTCDGSDLEEGKCMRKPCNSADTALIQTKWANWGEWSSCSSSCGAGEKKRYRKCLPDAGECVEGEETEQTECSHEPCKGDKDGHWTSWSKWSHCSQTCGPGHKERYRSCIPDTHLCEGDRVDESACMHGACPEEKADDVISSWSSWGEWSHCPVTCDTGHKKRYRKCVPEGMSCIGLNVEDTECSHKLCHAGLPAKTESSWSSWTTWSSCSNTCGPGEHFRVRSCIPKGSHCDGVSKDVTTCEQDPCSGSTNTPTTDPWDAWSEWSECSASCGSGQQIRMRVCRGSLSDCQDTKNQEIQSCKAIACVAVSVIRIPSAGIWALWSQWTNCSTTCGPGVQTRRRTCHPANKACVGDITSLQSCHLKPCDPTINITSTGLWAEWTEWSKCSALCGPGQQVRKRVCHPISQSCIGDIHNVQSCLVVPCKAGNWREWSTWSHCSTTCGKGQKKRTRMCIPNSSQCSGARYDVNICIIKGCGKELMEKHTDVLQGKIAKLKCCSHYECHRSKYKWLKPDGELIVPSNSSNNRFFAINSYLIIEKAQQKDMGNYRCLRIKPGSIKGIILPLVVKSCRHKPCKNKGICSDEIVPSTDLYKTICECPPDYTGNQCEIDKSSPFTTKLSIILAAILGAVVFLVLVGLITYCCYRRRKLNRRFDNKMNVLLEFNHDNVLNSCNKNKGPDHSALNKSHFFCPENTYPESTNLIRTTAINTVTETDEWAPGESETNQGPP